MITSGLATFKVFSTVTTPERITELLGATPTFVEHTGDVRKMGSTAAQHRWMLTVDETPNTEADNSGSAALTALLDRLPMTSIPDLPEDCEAGIWWSGSSDSVQGGFVLPAPLLARLGKLGVGVWGTVYLDQSEDG